MNKFKGMVSTAIIVIGGIISLIGAVVAAYQANKDSCIYHPKLCHPYHSKLCHSYQ